MSVSPHTVVLKAEMQTGASCGAGFAPPAQQEPSLLARLAAVEQKMLCSHLTGCPTGYSSDCLLALGCAYASFV